MFMLEIDKTFWGIFIRKRNVKPEELAVKYVNRYDWVISGGISILAIIPITNIVP